MPQMPDSSYNSKGIDQKKSSLRRQTKKTMRDAKKWNRREFVTVSAAAVAATQLPLDAQQPKPVKAPRSAMLPPEVTAGVIQPLLEGHTARPMRYRAEGSEFVIVNGAELYNRPLYGPNNAFRIDAGDLPEFSLYLPGHGGNLRLGFSAADGAKWLAKADKVTARYRPGRMIYEVQDALLGDGSLRIELLTAGEGAGLLVRAEAQGIAKPVALTWAFGGASGRKGRRSGDIGCELEPVSRFFAVRAAECAHNEYMVDGEANGKPRMVRLQSPFCTLAMSFPAGAELRVADFSEWDTPVRMSERGSDHTSTQPVLTGWAELAAGEAQYISIARVGKEQEPPVQSDAAQAFAERSRKVEAIAATLRAETSDSTIDAACAALGVAADGIWDEAQQCVMHGGVAWRMPLAGWRGPYALDALGWHERARKHFRHWLANQNMSPVTTDDPASGPYDAGSHLSRKESLLHSNGNLSHNHYDMNLVFFDAVFRHLRWTGDLEFAREVWPALERHLAWEKRLFRRVYYTKDGRELPLYEAYAAIWASDNLQYNGGGAAHSTAYMLFALREAVKLGKALGKDTSAYEREAGLVEKGLRELLWIPEKGVLAESKDILGDQTVYCNPALWTVYHAIDSEAVSPQQAWQMIAERLHELKKIQVAGQGVPAGDWYMLSCSNWLPYIWSLNLLVLAENVHMALAMWQAGMADEAYKLLKGNLLDSMFQGITPGNLHMTSQLDVHRQEAQRDFGDPIGITARALVEGLFGVAPDLPNGVVRVRPGFPADWNHASLKHADFDFTWKREGRVETVEFTSRFAKPVALELRLRALGTLPPQVIANGAKIGGVFDLESIGAPLFVLKLPAARQWKARIEWNGAKPIAAPAMLELKLGEPLHLNTGDSRLVLDDPQKSLDQRMAARREGFHMAFAQLRDGTSRWQMPVSFHVKRAPVAPLPKGVQFARKQLETIDLSAVLKHELNTLYTRSYAEPRSPYCSLALPEQLVGGWANNNSKAMVDDSGLRAAGGVLPTALGVDFRTPPSGPNCVFVSQWQGDMPSVGVPLVGRAQAVYLLMTGTTYPQASRMKHGSVTVRYADGSMAALPLVNPETWWPANEDYLLDDYLFVDEAELPARVDLATGRTQVLETATFKGAGREVKGGAATILGLRLDPAKELHMLRVECDLYGVVLALLGMTLVRA